MRLSIYSYLCLAFIALSLCAMTPARASHIELPFITVEEYIQMHPDQDALTKTFNEIVHAKGTPLKATQDAPVKIAFIYPGKQISDYWRRSVNSFRARMDEIGLKYEMFEYFSKPAVEYDLQEQQLREALQNDPDYLVFTMDVIKHKRLIENLLSRKRPKLILQNITTPMREWEGRQPFLYVGFDHTTGSKMLADFFIEKTGGTGAYGVLYFTRGYVSTMRGDMFINYLNSHSLLRLLGADFTDGDPDIIKQTATALLQRPSMKFLYACSTDIAIGTIAALKQTKTFGKVMVNGWGGGSSELEAILAGDLDVTVMRMNDDNGVAMAEAIRLDVEGKGDEVPTIYSGEMVLVEKGISRKELDALVERAFRYSN